MIITLYWWYIPIILFIAPFIYTALRKPRGDYDFQFDVILCFLGCWCALLFFFIGRYF